MDTVEDCSTSLFSLAKKLALSISHDERGKVLSTSVAKRRTHIYESILRASTEPQPPPPFHQYELLRQMFTCLVGSSECAELRERYEQLQGVQELVKEHSEYFHSPMGNAIAFLLLNISEVKVVAAPEKPKNIKVWEPFNFHTPAPFGLIVHNDDNDELRDNSQQFEELQDLRNPMPKFFKSVDYLRSKLDKEPLKACRSSPIMLSDINELRGAYNAATPVTKLPGIFERSLVRLREPKVNTPRVSPHLPLIKPPQQKMCNEPEVEPSSGGSCSPDLPKHFISDLNLTHELKRLHCKEQGQSFEPYIIELPDLIDDLKKAAVGLQSESCIIGPNGLFCLRSNLTLASVLPEVLVELTQRFLECGDCYLRLRFRSKWQRGKFRTEGLLNRAMRQAVSDFLIVCRQFFLALPGTTLTHLIRGASSTMGLLQKVDHMFSSEPRLNIAEGTTGACLLSYIWTAIDCYVTSEYSELLLYFLKRLCQTYYAQMQKWLYNGILEGQFNELFVSCHVAKYHECSKEFFDKGYVVHSEAVPGFLVGCEQAIVQCGKYNMLLKAYKSKHPLFELNHPNIVVCLSNDEIKTMRQNLEEHYAGISGQFEPCNIQLIYEQRAAVKQRLKNFIFARTQAHIEAWEIKQKQLFKDTKAQKKQLFDQLSAQREEELQNKLEQRRLDIVRDLEVERERVQLEDQRMQREKQRLQKRIGILQEVVKIEATAEVDPPGSIHSPSSSNGSSSDRSFVSCCDEVSAELNTTVTPPLTTLAVVELKRSHSDVLNSNEEQHLGVLPTDLECNRKRMMSSQNVDQSEPRVHLQERVLALSTEAQRNKLRVLSCSEQIAPHDENLNTLSATVAPNDNSNELSSDLQRNRQRMMQHDMFSAFNSVEDAHAQRSKCLLTADTERARNRRRVMESEFDIIVGNIEMQLPLERHKLYVEEESVAPGTPMSTTSDVEATMTTSHEEKCQDTVNNNQTNVLEKQINTSENNEQVSEGNVLIDDILQGQSQSSEPIEGLSTLPTFFSISHAKPVQAPCKLETLNATAKAHNPYMIKSLLQESLLLPLNAHFGILRNEVMRIFFVDSQIYEHFRQLRNHFLMFDGQFGAQLTTGLLGHIEDGMDPRSLCHKGILDAILDNALSINSTEWAQNLTLNCHEIPEGFDLMSLRALSIFNLQYKVDWPLNLVISSEALAKYAQIFSYLMKLRHVSFVLERAYGQLQQLAKLHGFNIRMSPQYRHIQMVRHKLYHFVSTLQNHLASNALQSSWKMFKDQLRNVNTVEGLYQQHVAYLKRVSFLTLLNRQSSKFQETIDGIFLIALRFCKILQSQDFALEGEHFVHPRYKRLVYEDSEFDKFMRYIIYLGNKVAASGYQEEIGDLIRIINFNNYYKLSEATST
ncbi:gamma-tubulin complex component 6 [Scaptodrosophila lebanonensis]|uniref:Gamma-tubulin complex component 6 n=1 Tax=Drosophila lebanonensis TaxID=7225 RepID=A0A6J2TCB4_DROLE|nr:gamma-tubulin complex component 6 [Scaptodrosophila lebanonensis]